MRSSRKCLIDVQYLIFFIYFPAFLSAQSKYGDIKLVDGPNGCVGTIIIYDGSRWGTVCDDGWSLIQANIVCKQLNKGYAVRALKRNKFASSNKIKYLIDDIKCKGNETKLLQCNFPGWGKHNCRNNEQAGVQCMEAKSIQQKNNWDPLGLTLSKEKIKQFGTVDFKIDRVELVINNLPNVSPVIVLMKNVQPGPICPDYATSVTASVLCKTLGKGVGGHVIQIPMSREYFPAQRHLLLTGRCYGNETSIQECINYSSVSGVPCKTDNALAIKCMEKLPDLKPDSIVMQSSSYVQDLRLWHLGCAIEEGCLPESVNAIVKRNPGEYLWKVRRLLRFSSIIENIGTGSFVPFDGRENWKWHACHMHYHSMKVFAVYKVVNEAKSVVASSHKASFCLEDSTCNHGIMKYFQCSNAKEDKGTQGISPGCKDTYLHDYDCQWVDITDVPPGDYSLDVIYNPDMLVPELNFFNNGLRCNLHLSKNTASVNDCLYFHPMDLA